MWLVGGGVLVGMGDNGAGKVGRTGGVWVCVREGDGCRVRGSARRCGVWWKRESVARESGGWVVGVTALGNGVVRGSGEVGWVREWRERWVAVAVAGEWHWRRNGAERPADAARGGKGGGRWEEWWAEVGGWRRREERGRVDGEVGKSREIARCGTKPRLRENSLTSGIRLRSFRP